MRLNIKAKPLTTLGCDVMAASRRKKGTPGSSTRNNAFPSPSGSIMHPLIGTSSAKRSSALEPNLSLILSMIFDCFSLSLGPSKSGFVRITFREVLISAFFRFSSTSGRYSMALERMNISFCAVS